MFKGLSKPAIRALNSINVTSLADITKYSEQDLLSLHGFGPKGIRIVKEILTEQGLSLNKENQLKH